MKRLRNFLKERPLIREPYLRAAFFWKARRSASRWAGLPSVATVKSQPEVMVFSRFGTETTGNHLIQLGLLRAIFEASPERNVYFLSTNLSVTNAGLAGIRELLRRTGDTVRLAAFIAERVFVAGEDKVRSLGPGDLLMLGGGPIMDDPELTKWVLWFEWAHRAGARVVIAGCGLGPLQRSASIRRTERLLALAHAAVIRNRVGENFTHAAGSALQFALDPAFLCMPFLSPLVRKKRGLLAVNTRKIGFECNPERVISDDEVVQLVVDQVAPLAQWMQISEVVPFSTCELGSQPDSNYATRVAEQLAGRLGIHLRQLPETTVGGFVDMLLSAEFVVSTRMHGFIAALMLGCKAANLDYIAGGGKSAELYREWLGRASPPSLFVAGSLKREDFVSLSELGDVCRSIDTLLETYAGAIRAALGMQAGRELRDSERAG